MLLVPRESVALPNSQPHCTIHWPAKVFELPETFCGRLVPALRITRFPVPVSTPVKLKARFGEIPPTPPFAPWEIYDCAATWTLPVTTNVVSSPPLSIPPL